MERVRYPWWVSPFFGVMGVGFFVVALGGPGRILAATLAFPVVLAALVCLALGVTSMVATEWWGRRIAPPRNPAEATRRGNRRLAVMAVLIAAGLIALRIAADSSSPIFRAVAFGLVSGVFLGGAIVLPIDKRRRLAFEAPPEDSRP